MTLKFVLKLKLTVLLIWQKHSFDFSGSDLNSGIYFCRLEGKNSSRIAKVALIK